MNARTNVNLEQVVDEFEFALPRGKALAHPLALAPHVVVLAVVAKNARQRVQLIAAVANAVDECAHVVPQLQSARKSRTRIIFGPSIVTQTKELKSITTNALDTHSTW